MLTGTCPTCGDTRVRVNPSTMRFYKHAKPGTVVKCPGSGKKTR